MGEGRSQQGKGHSTKSKNATDIVEMGPILAQATGDVPTAGRTVTHMDPKALMKDMRPIWHGTKKTPAPNLKMTPSPAMMVEQIPGGQEIDKLSLGLADLGILTVVCPWNELAS